MRAHIVDPSAYTPPYDHALSAALGAAGVDTTLYTSRFAYGSVPPASGYRRVDLFYRLARGAPGSRIRLTMKLAEHVPDMVRYRRVARKADIVHFQWLALQYLDAHLLPRGRPLVLTAHDVLPREPRAGQIRAQRRLYERFDAIVVHSQHGRNRLIEEVGVAAQRVHIIEHGVFTHLAALPPQPPPVATEKLVVLCFGLIRPYKGIDVLIEAWQGIEGAELWIAGMPRMDIAPLRAAAGPSVRFFPEFIPQAQLPAFFNRADIVVLPYREIDQSGVLFTALAFGKPLLLTDVGGFPEIAASGAARLVPPGDPVSLHDALRELIAWPGAREQLAAAGRAAVSTAYSWERIAVRTAGLYRELLG